MACTWITGIIISLDSHSRDRENTLKRRGCLWKCKAFRSFLVLQKGSRTPSCLSVRRLEKHHADSREKVPYMLGGRRRCWGKAACKHGVLFSLLSLVSVYNKKLWSRNFVSIFQGMRQNTWEQSHRNRTGKKLRSACNFSSCPEHGNHTFTSGLLPFETSGWKLYCPSKCFIL